MGDHGCRLVRGAVLACTFSQLCCVYTCVSRTLLSRCVCVCACACAYRGKDTSGPSEYYSLEALLFLLKNVKLPHPLYVTRATVSWLVMLSAHAQ